MRRAIALLLMLMFSSLLMAPLFASDPEANLPPCCRSHGRHHCMMQRMQRPDGRPGFTAMREKCPCFPSGTVASHSGQFVPAPGRHLHASAASPGHIPQQIDPAFASAYFDSHRKRGPPPPLV
jgi:hypothetical protein